MVQVTWGDAVLLCHFFPSGTASLSTQPRASRLRSAFLAPQPRFCPMGSLATLTRISPGPPCDLNHRLSAFESIVWPRVVCRSIDPTGANGWIPTLEPPNGQKYGDGEHPLAGSA